MANKKEELNLQETKVEEKVTKRKTTKAREESKNISATSKTKKTTTKKVAEKDSKTATKSTSKPKSTTKKSSSKNASLKDDVVTTSKTSSKVKTTTAKKSTNTKTNSSKKASSSKNVKEKINSNTAKAKEETIIEKIKSFIAKIVAMQEEARNEELAKKKKEKNEKIKNELGVLESSSYMPEYYDLPYRYNETVVRILAQTPKRIFVYWDIADEDRIRYEKAFGNDFYEKTYPVLLVHNDDKGYTTEIPINDFANSWYINIKDSKSKYTIQLGRKFKTIPTNIDTNKVKEQNIILKTDYLPIAQSNILEVPNDRVLFNEMPSKIIYRNVKNYEEKEIVVAEIKTPFGVLYNLKEFYEDNYKDEMIDEEIFNLNNPTSGGLSSSSFK